MSGFQGDGNLDGAPSTSSGLVEQVRAFDSEGWQRLTDVYGPVVYRWCRSAGLPAQDAADVIQEVFLAVAKYIPDFHRDRPGDTFGGWLWTITRNKIQDQWRRCRGRPVAQGGTDAQQRLEAFPESVSDSAQPDSSQVEADSLEQRAIELVRAGVEDRTWQAFWDLTVENAPAAEIAQQLRMTTSAVYKAKYRVLRLIRNELQDLTE
jgi:RNA polymerase sigma-70 factor (ECF subfamily)